MKISNDFTLALPPDQAYALLLDIEQVTPCIPGAELGDANADHSRDLTLTVQLGPMKFTYDGTVRISEQDDSARRAVLLGRARETRGRGGARATVTMTVSGDAATSQVATVADVNLTGRAAQMGGGLVEDVASRMIAEMARCLAERYPQPTAPSSLVALKDVAAPKPVRAFPLIVSILWNRIIRTLSRIADGSKQN